MKLCVYMLYNQLRDKDALLVRQKKNIIKKMNKKIIYSLVHNDGDLPGCPNNTRQREETLVMLSYVQQEVSMKASHETRYNTTFTSSDPLPVCISHAMREPHKPPH